MAFTNQIRQAISDMHDEALTKVGETVVRDVTIGGVQYRLKMVVQADGEIVLRSRKL